MKLAFESFENNPIDPEPNDSKTLVLIIPIGDDVCSTHFESESILK